MSWVGKKWLPKGEWPWQHRCPPRWPWFALGSGITFAVLLAVGKLGEHGHIPGHPRRRR